MSLWDQHLSPGPRSVDSPTGTEPFSRDDLCVSGQVAKSRNCRVGVEGRVPIEREVGLRPEARAARAAFTDLRSQAGTWTHGASCIHLSVGSETWLC